MSMWINTKRVMRYGVAGFIRNGFVSLAAILIMTITLFVIGGLLLGSAAMSATLQQLTEKVDVTVYFMTDAPEESITTIRTSLEALPEVAVATYVSREDALVQFRLRHANDPLTLQALDELGENPLGASLEIRARETSQYESIATYLESVQSSGSPEGAAIDRVNFFQNKTAIDRLTNIIQTSQTIGLVVAIVLGIASTLIALNTIRLAIYTAREEIGVMNLVGAGRWYVRGPFMIAGVLYGLVSGVVVLLILYPLTLWIGPGTEQFLGNFNPFSYYMSAFPFFFLVIMGGGIGLGALSSYLAVRRYLRT